jgi:prepilin-type N-terminal cleavage/methylation domain-containing protein
MRRCLETIVSCGSPGWRKKRVLRQQQGYTLIELMVAMSIMGVLASTTVVAEQKYMNAGRPEALRVEYRTIATATQAYLNDNKRLPSSDDQLASEGYIDSVPTLANYTIDSNGKITQVPNDITSPWSAMSPGEVGAP